MTLRKVRTVILVADDDATIRNNLALLLRSENYEVCEAADGLQAEAAWNDRSISLVLLDLNMPGRNGMELLREHADRLEQTPVIVITAYGGSSARDRGRDELGAFDYISKPFDLDEVLFTVRRALTQQALAAQVQSLALPAAITADIPSDEELIGRTPAMVNVFKMIGRVAGTREPVLITGESGTGKELVANAIHRSSSRSDKPFVKASRSAALNSTLLESEMHARPRTWGIYRQAITQRVGRFEQANDGTLFLDEIGDMDIDLQAKLLRVLQAGQFERVGGDKTIETDVRIISATNRDLHSRINDGTFREDLFFRLNVVTIELPPLRERREDIPQIANRIVSRLSGKYGWPQLTLSPDAVDQLTPLPWPGNVRELQNVLARAAILSGGRVIQTGDLQFPPAGSEALSEPLLLERWQAQLTLWTSCRDRVYRVIAQALEQEGWNRTRAAQQLGISRRQLYRQDRCTTGCDEHDSPGECYAQSDDDYISSCSECCLKDLNEGQPGRPGACQRVSRRGGMFRSIPPRRLIFAA